MTSEINRCYRALELEPGASLEQVKQAWREQPQGGGVDQVLVAYATKGCRGFGAFEREHLPAGVPEHIARRRFLRTATKACCPKYLCTFE